MIFSQKVDFRQPPERDILHFQGKIYSHPAPSPLDIIRNPASLNHIEADAAIVHYDREKKRWRLLRDFGQTPLYYAPVPNGFIWSFTLTGLLEHLDNPRPDEATMFDYLATHYRYIFRDPSRTFHEGVFQVPAGSLIDIDERGGLTANRWLDLSPEPELYRLGPEEATERLMEILRESVRLRVRAARRPAFTVSSGLDSSTVASLASEYVDEMRVFSVGYSGEGVEEFDETEGVAELVRGRGWQWTHLMLDCPDLITEAGNLISLTQSPITTVTWLAYYLMAKQLQGFSELFNGLGGDESLAGEFVHFFYFFADLKAEGLDDRLAAEVEGWSRLHDHPVFKKNAQVLEDFWQRNIDFQTGDMRVDQKVYQANWRFFNPDWLAVYGPKAPPMPRPYPNYLSNRLFQEIRFETTPPTLWGMFMANQVLGLTGVSPFMSTRLFKLCLALPGTVKYDHGLTKALLRRGLKGVLPESLRLNHKKTGFNAPIHQWFNNSKVSRPLLELLNNGPIAKMGWLKPGAAEQILKEHETGQANHMMLLWPLLNASLFLK
ncbi:hypothetical protein C4J81_11460 [Deltaproteobacteria bacterium Smac51]|nr:hypothetical protein C4J81_11460 [Deltaproteobacteria bacterium Smac51]